MIPLTFDGVVSALRALKKLEHAVRASSEISNRSRPDIVYGTAPTAAPTREAVQGALGPYELHRVYVNGVPLASPWASDWFVEHWTVPRGRVLQHGRRMLIHPLDRIRLEVRLMADRARASLWREHGWPTRRTGRPSLDVVLNELRPTIANDFNELG